MHFSLQTRESRRGTVVHGRQEKEERREEEKGNFSEGKLYPLILSLPFYFLTKGHIFFAFLLFLGARTENQRYTFSLVLFLSSVFHVFIGFFSEYSIFNQK